MKNSAHNPLEQDISKAQERIIKVALDNCLTEGAHNLSFQKIANILEVSQAALYKHFKNKEDLLTEAIAWAAQEGGRYFQKDTPPNLSAREEMKLHIYQNLFFVASKRPLGNAVIMMHYFAGTSFKIKKLHEEINQLRKSRFERWLYQMEKQEQLNFIDIFSLAEVIHSLLMGEMIKAFHWHKSPTIQERHLKLWQQIELLLEASITKTR